MKSKSILRTTRTVLAMLVIIPFIFLFIDFGSTELRPLWFLSKLQIAPATLSLFAGAGSALLLATLLIVTLLVGRVYCSVICPFGILQDMFTRLGNIGKKKNKRRKFTYSTPLNILRYSILSITVVCTALGFSAVLGWLDPYSNFGRIAKNIVGLAYASLNNLAATVFSDTLYYVSLKSFEAFTFGFSLFVLISVGVMAIWRGRLFCNSICPVGALLSLVSRFSLFKLQLNEASCNSCGLCAMRCKSQCIDSKNKTLDFSRCVTCYNCIDACNRKALSYQFALRKPTPVSTPSKPISDALVSAPADASKRRFLTGAAIALGGAAVAKARKNLSPAPIYKKEHSITPPGSLSITHLKSKCTACHLCIAQCPTQVIRPAFLEYGVDGIMMPLLDYKRDFCNFECTLCSEICPTGAIQRLTTDEKKQTQIGQVYFQKELCVVYTDGTDCGACSEHCPTKAVDMKPFRDGLYLPEVDRSICIGCGGCEYICPVRPLRAIYVEGNPTHLTAEKPREEKKVEIELDGFGF